MNTITHIGKVSRPFNPSSPFHSHTDLELVYFVSGSGHYIIENSNKILIYKAGQVVLIPPNVVHANQTGVGYSNICLSINSPEHIFKEPIVIDDDSDHSIYLAFETAYRHYNSLLKQKELLLSSLGSLIINYMIAYRDYIDEHPIVSRIKADITENYKYENYSITSFLDSLPFTPDYVRQLFKKSTGLTPNVYLLNVRMEAAKEYLSTSVYEKGLITQIANKCGFSDSLYFSRVFKKQFGLSPYEFYDNISESRKSLK